MRSERAASVSETVRQAAQALLSSLSTSYGPKGLDKMMVRDGKSLVTNDGATILGYYREHPVHRILSSMCAAQDAGCGDGTTSVVLLACCLVEQLHKLRERGVHASRIVDALEVAKRIALRYIDDVKTAVDEGEFVNVALTSLGSKIASRSAKMARVALEALSSCAFGDIRVMKRVGGTIEDIELRRGVLLDRDVEVPRGRYRMLVLQFCLSPPKTNMDSKILIDDYALMERFVREEREYVVRLVRAVKRSGATLLVVQKSLLRESVSELARHFLRKLGIRYVDGVDRKEVEYLCRMLGVRPVTDADLIEDTVEVEAGTVRGMVEVAGAGCSVVLGGCDELVLDEAERSLNDVFGVLRSLMCEPSIVPGGGAVEVGIAAQLDAYTGPNSLVVAEISRGFLALPHYLVRNAGMNAVEVVSQLRKNIVQNRNLGISLRSGMIADMVNDEKIIQPAAVSKSMVALAVETVQMLVRIDDILPTVQ